jgi:hypothetical protein
MDQAMVLETNQGNKMKHTNLDWFGILFTAFLLSPFFIL